MAKKLHLCAFVGLVFSQIINYSCSPKNKEKEIASALVSSIQESDISINKSTQEILKSLDEMASDPCTRERALIWYNNAKHIEKATHTFNMFLSDLDELSSIEDSSYKKF